MLQVSTKLKDLLVAPFPAAFAGGAIFIYGGARPTTADQVAGSAPIAIVTNLGLMWNPTNTYYGLSFVQEASTPYILFDSSISPAITVMVDGTAAWWRLVAPGDDGSLASYDLLRVDGDVGLKASPGGQEMLLDDVVLVAGDSIPLGYFLYTLPPIVGA
jgi:hypothetical protein